MMTAHCSAISACTIYAAACSAYSMQDRWTPQLTPPVVVQIVVHAWIFQLQRFYSLIFARILHRR
jgi:hypothetical protein